MNRKYVVANWKCHKDEVEVKNWIAEFLKFKSTHPLSNLEVVVCPSFTHLAMAKSLLGESAIVGAQTVSPFPNGTYTGAVSARMVSEYAEFTLVGHSERREYFLESDPMVANQAIQALENNLTPIIAVDQSNWSSQLAQLDTDQLKKCFVMFEPPEAISTYKEGQAADLETVKTAVSQITSSYPVKGCFYGGSVSAANVQTYLQEASLWGVVVGAASLEITDFSALLAQATQLNFG